MSDPIRTARQTGGSGPVNDPARLQLVATTPASGNDVLLEDVHVVDVESGTESETGVLISGGTIAAIDAPDALMRLSPDAGRLSLHGMYLTPGLFNMHNHLSLALPGEYGDRMDKLDTAGIAYYMADGARRTLYSGVTTVRSVAERRHVDFALRRAIQSGEVLGPDLYTAGQAIVCTGGHGHENDDTVQCDGADGFAHGVRAQIRAGADVIKVMISGGIAGQHEGIATPQLTDAEMEAVISTAHAWGRKVTAHAGPAEVIDRAIELGLDCVEHGYQLTPEVARKMAERAVALVPTLIVTRCKDFFDQLGVPDWMQQRSLGAGPRHVDSYRMALAAGVQILLGSDMPPFWVFDGTTAIVRELEHISAFGLGPEGALRAATINPAGWLGIADQVGSIAVGKRANLIAMPENPLADTSAFRGIGWVMKGGMIVRDDRMGMTWQ